MKVTFTGGPLDGREEEIPDDKLEEGHPVYWPKRPEVDDDTVRSSPGSTGSWSTSTTGTAARTTSAGSSKARSLDGCPSRCTSRPRGSARSPVRSTGRAGAGPAVTRGRPRDALRLRRSLRGCPEGIRRPLRGTGARVDTRGRRATRRATRPPTSRPFDRTEGRCSADRPTLADQAREVLRACWKSVRVEPPTT